MNKSEVSRCGCAAPSVSRRSLLKSAVGLGGATGISQLLGESVMHASFGATTGNNVLVVLSLRGGIDGLGVVVPHGDPGYYAARPTTSVDRGALICRDDMFGLHPALTPLEPYWTSGQIAAVQAVGLPTRNRSHFAAIEEIEDADLASDERVGWLHRMVGMTSDTNILEAVQVGQSRPNTSLFGSPPAFATLNMAELRVPGLNINPERRYSSLETAWSQSTSPLAQGLKDAVTLSRGPGQTLSQLPKSTVQYPTGAAAGPYAGPLSSAAQLIKADLGTSVIAIDAGNWDMHVNYGTTASGNMASGLSGLASSLRAFLDDLGSARSRVTLVTISEFGRRTTENANRGFDHGWGNMMLVAGPGVKGGRYWGSWPGLGGSDDDLLVTTDYRNVLGEIIGSIFPHRSIAATFPGIRQEPLGFMRSA